MRSFSRRTFLRLAGLWISRGGDVTISITMHGAIWNGFGKWMPAEHFRP